MTLSQAEYKQMKKDVDEHGAYGVGFFEGIESKIPLYVWVDLVRKIGEEGWVRLGMTDSELRQLLVTEAIRLINYQDFKDLAPYLFSYPREQREKDKLVRPVEISRDYFEELKANAQELLAVKQELSADQPLTLADLVRKVEQETVIQDTGLEVLGISQDRSELLVFDSRTERADHYYYQDFLEDERLINDYRDSRSSSAQVMEALLDYSSQLEEYIYTFYTDAYQEATGILEGLEEVQNHYQEDGLDTGPLDGVKTTEELWELAQESPSFVSSYDSLVDYLDGYAMRTYILDNTDQLLEHDQHLEVINEMLAKDGMAFRVKTIRGDFPGEEWVLGAIYDRLEHSASEVDYFLEHEAGAAYRGSLGALVLVDKEKLEDLGLSEAVSEATSRPVDLTLLEGKDKLELLSQAIGREDFTPIDQAMTELSTQNKNLIEEPGFER